VTFQRSIYELSLKNEKAQFKLALRKFLNTNSFYSVMNFSYVQMTCIPNLYECVNVHDILHCNVSYMFYVYDMFHILLSCDSLKDLRNI